MNHRLTRRNVVVLGAGIQGTSVALGLAREGHAVTLVDRAPNCMLRTSLVNEGKIHLGHVYANDDSFRTSRLMLDAALRFAPIMEQCLGAPVPWTALRSTPFTYVVSSDSLVAADVLAEHYDRLNRYYRETTHEAGCTYLGDRPDVLWEHAPVPQALNPRLAVAAIRTPEVSIDMAALGGLIRNAIGTSGIDTLYGHTTIEASRIPSGFRVGGTTDTGAAWTRTADVLVNCLWAGRLAVDAQLGLAPLCRPAYRLKYRILVDLPPELSSLPSMTVVLGPFGDIVTYPGQRTAYVSWYPACMRAWSSETSVPASWLDAAAGHIDVQTARTITGDSLEAFDALVPGMARSTNARVAAGIIVAWGRSDIDDPASQLHERHQIGITEQNDYFSIDTGKLTTAPLFARELVRRMQASR